MGNKSTRQLLTYEEASKLLTIDEFERVQSWYKRCTAGPSPSSDGISLKAFTHEILCDDAPDDFAKALYEAFGASNQGSSNRGLAFKDLICGLSVVTKGSQEDRGRFLFNYFSSDGEYIYANEFYKQLAAFEQGRVPSVAYDLFRGITIDSDRANLEQFLQWVCTHRRSLAITDWLLSDPPKLSLTVSKNFSNIPTFFSTLAGVTHLQEKDIEELEKQYKFLVDSRVGKLTLERFRSCVQPPLPESLVEGLFRAFDDNCDCQIDFKELVCGVSECCRAPTPSRLLFCLKAFDIDRDGYLSQNELRAMFEQLLHVRAENSPHLLATDDPRMLDVEALVHDIRGAHGEAEKIPLKEVANWLDPCHLADDLLTPLFQMCHIVFGLSPRTKREEESIVRGWLDRERRRGYCEGQTWYLISKWWWKRWENWVDFLDDEWSSTLHQPTSNGGTPSIVKKTASQTSVYVENSVPNNNDRLLLISNTANQLQPTQLGLDQRYLNDGQSKQTKMNAGSRSPSTKSGTGTGRSWSPCPRVQTTAIGASVFFDQQQESTVERPGPIDNTSLIIGGKDDKSTSVGHQKLSSLTNEGGILKPSELLLGDGREFQSVPEVLWFALYRWYKGGSPALPRRVVRCPEQDRLDLELYPVQVVLLRHQQATATTGVLGGVQQRYQQNAASNYTSMPGITGSLVSGISAYTISAANAAMSALNYWSHAPRRVPSYTATFSKLTSVGEIFSFLCRQLRLNPDTARLWIYAPDENNLMQLEDEQISLGDVVDQMRQSQKSFGGEKSSSSSGERKLSSTNNWQLQILIEVRNADLTWPEEICGLAKSRQTSGVDSKSNASAATNRPSTSDTTTGTVVERGLTGLNNLGNTCFMNSALQCISNTKPLTQYFLRNVHLYELNRTNALGKKGQMALQYANLIQELWSGKFRVVAPLKLRCTVCKYASQFNDFQQHDSQELLSFLVDGLHEDLNRVHRKPYTELKDSDGRADEIVAAEAWDNHIKRNQSIVVDLLHGLLKSQVTCKQCQMTSVRFDPFTFLSLPLPLENCVFLQIVVVRLDGSTPVKYGLRLLADDRFEAIKEKLREYTGLPCDRLLIVQLSGNNLIQSFLNDRARVKPYANWTLYAYEIPASLTLKIKPTLASHDANGGGSSTNSVVDQLGVRLQETNGNLANGVVPLVHHSLSRTSNSSGDRLMPSHSRSPSNVSTTSSAGNIDANAGVNNSDAFAGFTVAIQRRMEQRESYVAAHNRYRCHQFGLPLIVPADIDERSWSGRHVYEAVFSQLARFLSTSNSLKAASSNHAVNGDHRPGEYPFTLCMVQRQGAQRCARCPWYECCSGCPIQPSPDDVYTLTDCFVAIDWDPTELHLRYQPSAELTFMEHCSVKESYAAQMEPVSLDSCLRAFTTLEELKDNDTYYCGKCKAHCPASKKLDIWKLPPVLIFHFKRFQCINETRWVKSCKTVTFPIDDFDPSQYLASRTSSVEAPSLAKSSSESVENRNQKREAMYGNDDGNGNKRSKDRQKMEMEMEMETRSSRPTLNDDEEETRLSLLKCGQHDHRLKDEVMRSGEWDHLQYNLYAIVCHAGMLGAGHYVTYVRHTNGKWYLYNDSSCKEVSAKDIDYSLAYILFYERRGLDYDRYIPDVSDRQLQDVDKVDEECEADVKRFCVIQ